MAFHLPSLNTKSRISLGVCSPLVLLMVLGGISITSITSIVETDKWVEHTHKVLEQAAEIRNSALDMETGMRGYLLAGKAEFLQPFRSGEIEFHERIDDLRESVSDNPAHGEVILWLNLLINGNLL